MIPPVSETAETRYARTASGVHLAYQTVGEGPLDIVFFGPFITHVELLWEDPGARRFFEGLASFSRLVLYDKRGNGMSDPIVGALPTIEERVDDLRAVLEAAGCEAPVLFGGSEGGQIAALYAASNPDRCRGLAVYSSHPRTRSDPERGLEGISDRAFEWFVSRVEEDWGGEDVLRVIMPSVLADRARAEWWSRLFRRAISPGLAVAQLRANREADISDVLPSVRSPALVMHARDEVFIPPSLGRRFAELVPGSRFVEMPGGDHLPFGENGPAVVAEVRELVTGERGSSELDRALATVLFTDIVGSTEQAGKVGDREWRDLLDRHEEMLRRQLRRFDGREIKATGDGMLATFNGPARAIHCALAMIEGARAQGVSIRAGLHTGEIELRGGDIAGIAVHIAQRVSSLAEAGQVTVSQTVADLVVGSGIGFADLGTHSLKGLDRPWSILAVETP